MSDFEFVFVLYSLVLGLSLVELLSGFGKALERKLASEDGGAGFRMGWLTPLLGLFVILDLLSFWSFAWTLQNQVTVSTRMLLAVIAFASAYFMAARLVFPGEPGAFADLDRHYFRVHRIVFAILIALVFVQWAYLWTIQQIRAALVSPLSVGLTVTLIVLMMLAAWLRSRKWSAVVLVALIIRYTVVYLR